MMLSKYSHDFFKSARDAISEEDFIDVLRNAPHIIDVVECCRKLCGPELYAVIRILKLTELEPNDRNSPRKCTELLVDWYLGKELSFRDRRIS